MLQVCLLNKSAAFSLLKNAELNCQYTVIVVVCTAVSYKKDCLPILPYYKTLLFFAAAKSRLLLCILLPCSVLLFIYIEKKSSIENRQRTLNIFSSVLILIFVIGQHQKNIILTLRLFSVSTNCTISSVFAI